MTTRFRLLFLLLAATLTMTNPLRAEPSLAALFTDHMVLQADMPAPIWGTAEPGERVTVSFANQEVSAAADKSGRWQVTLKPMKTSAEPRVLRVNSKSGAALQCEDVLVGEVWLGSGQSNMWWPVRRSANPTEEIAAADYPNIRFFTVKQSLAGKPVGDVTGQWARCSPNTVGDFSATAYYFGRAIHQATNAPVGLIHASVRGTPIEMWIPREVLEANADSTPILNDWQLALQRWSVDRFPDPEANASQYWDETMQWYAGYMERYTELRANGVKNPRDEMSKAYLDEFNDRKLLELLLKNEMPAAFYNAMIAPLAPVAVRGVIWYQGESNANRPDGYDTLLSALIESWRAKWNQGEMAFHIVGIANIHEQADKPVDSGWARIRDAQFRVHRNTPGSGFANTIDIGEVKTAHAKNKQDVGNRLARAALLNTYGHKDVVASGPIFEAMEKTSEGLVIRFAHAHGGLTKRGNEPLAGFAVAGADQTWHWANATILDDKSVLLTSPDVPNPIAVRYAWADNPKTNLYNAHDLPAVPFRTDDWPYAN